MIIISFLTYNEISFFAYSRITRELSIHAVHVALLAGGGADHRPVEGHVGELRRDGWQPNMASGDRIADQDGVAA